MRAAFLLLLATSLLPAQIPGSFTQIDIDCGGWFTGIQQHQSGRLYGRTDVGGIYRSDDRGDSWTFLSGDFPTPGGLCVQGIAISNGDPDTVFQACGVSYFSDDPNRGIWKSKDAGKSWRQVKANINFSGNDKARHGGECLIVHPKNDDEIWVGSNKNGLWQSVDAGADWQEISPDIFGSIVITGITIHASFPDQIWVSGEGGLWISRDRGAHWQQTINAGVVFRTARRKDGSGFAIGGKYDPASPTDTKLWHLTKDDWSKAGAPTLIDRWPNYVTAFRKEKGYDPVDQAAALGLLRDGSLVTAGFFRAPAISNDNGKTFKILPTQSEGQLPVWAIPDRGNHQGGWNQIIQDIKTESTWFTTGGYGPGRSDNSGRTWKYITEGLGEVVTWRPQFHPTDRNTILIPSADHGLVMATYDENSGKAWNTISKYYPYPNDILTFVHSTYAMEKDIIAFGGAPISGEARIWKSESAGADWKKLPAKGYPQKHGHMWVEMSSSPHEIIALMGGEIGPGKGGIYRSTDLGSSFKQITLPVETLGKNAGNEFVWQTRLRADGGDSSRHYLSIRDSGIYRSIDKGLTWHRVRQEGLPTTHGHLGVDHQTKHCLWFTSNKGLHRSDDSGDSWLSIDGFESSSDVDAVDGRVAIIGKLKGDDFKKIYYSGDNGKNWREITRKGYRFGNMTAVAVDPYRPGKVWISTSGRSTAVFTPTQ
ncbi:MAG: hypothetical protein ABF382_05460 [Akkermansiaceae bacterium]